VLITKARGKFIESDSDRSIFITIHPSAIYRHREKEEQDKEYRRFVSEIKQVQRRLKSKKPTDFRNGSGFHISRCTSKVASTRSSKFKVNSSRTLRPYCGDGSPIILS
jgi:hypothetical protein